MQCICVQLPTPCGNYTDWNGTNYAAVSDQTYHDRGPIQLSWNYNYGFASQQILGITPDVWNLDCVNQSKYI